MASEFQLDIVSAEKRLFSGAVRSVQISGTEGDLGIRAGHTPLLTRIKPGPVTFQSDDGSELLYVEGGVLEVQPHNVTVLADTCLRSDELNEAAAQQAKADAEKVLETTHGGEDYAVAKVELIRAVAQLRVLRMAKELQK